MKEKHIDTRYNRVDYGASDTFSDDGSFLCIQISRITKEKIFRHISPVTIDLKKSYIDNLNIKEASSRTKALINNHGIISITTATATVLEKEQHADPKLMMNVMDDRADIAIKKSEA